MSGKACTAGRGDWRRGRNRGDARGLFNEGQGNVETFEKRRDWATVPRVYYDAFQVASTSYCARRSGLFSFQQWRRPHMTSLLYGALVVGSSRKRRALNLSVALLRLTTETRKR